MLHWISVKHFCCGVVSNEEGIIIEAAPILKWGVGKHYSDVLSFYRRKNQLLEHRIVK